MWGRLTSPSRMTASRPGGKAARARRDAVVGVTPLEDRALLSTLTITEGADPAILWPPNGKMVPVTVSGTIADAGSTVTGAEYTIHDSEAGTTSAPVAIAPIGGPYSFTVELQARRAGSDRAGRTYTISVSAVDQAGTRATDSAVVVVPHDMGHHGLGGRLGAGGFGQEGRHRGPHRPGWWGGGSRIGGLGQDGGPGGAGAGGASNSLRFGGPGQGQTNTVSVTGNNGTVIQNVTNNQADIYNINNSFNATVPSTPVDVPVSFPSGGGDVGDGHGNGHGGGNDGGGNGQGDQGHGNGNGHKHNGGD